jgi:hypothetical protein
MRFRFRLGGRRKNATGRHEYALTVRTVEMVDAHDLLVHLLTEDAIAAGRNATAKYIALCGADVLPAAMVDPGERRCAVCLEQRLAVPEQRTPSSKPKTNPVVDRAALVAAAGLSAGPSPTPPEGALARPALTTLLAISRGVDGLLHRLEPLESSSVALTGSGETCCGRQVHTRKLQSSIPDSRGLCRLCWAWVPAS